MITSATRIESYAIRKAIPAELDRILAVYDDARAFMRTVGNPTQWSGGYPSRDVLEADIEAGRLYVCVEDGNLLGAFVFFVGEEPVYKTFKGDWGTDATTYGVIHRVAVSARERGVGAAMLAYGYERAPGDLRIDTHRDNRPMQALLTKCGFTPRGIVDYGPAGERIAFRKGE